VRGVPDLWLPLAMVAIIGTLTFNCSVVMPLFVERTLHGGDAAFTLLYSVLSLGSLAGALVAAHRATVGIHDGVTAADHGLAACAPRYSDTWREVVRIEIGPTPRDSVGSDSYQLSRSCKELVLTVGHFGPRISGVEFITHS